ncbi:EamA family transporter [Clostridium sp. JNZ X4-2]
MVCSTILLAVFSFQGAVQMMTAGPGQILSVLYLGAMPSAMAYFLWGKAMLLAEKASEVTNFMLVTSLLSTVLGFIMLKEIPNIGTFIGRTIIIFSIILFNIKGK